MQDSNVLIPEILDQKSYGAYGDVLGRRTDIAPVAANSQTAQRWNFLAKYQRLNAASQSNLCLFDVQAQVKKGQTNFEVKLLERHNFSTQAFVPMSEQRFLVLVARGAAEPDLSTLRAFVTNGQQGVTYHPGVWHHPLVAMDVQSQFFCLIDEELSSKDCDIFHLKSSRRVELASCY